MKANILLCEAHPPIEAGASPSRKEVPASPITATGVLRNLRRRKFGRHQPYFGIFKRTIRSLFAGSPSLTQHPGRL